MTYKEMIYLLKNKIYGVFTNTYLLNENKDPHMNYLKIRNILMKLLDKDSYDYSTKDFTYYYDFNSPVILKDQETSREITEEDIIISSIFLIQSTINELILHTTYYPADVKRKYIEFLNVKEEQMIAKLHELKRPETKILAKVI